MPLTDNAAALIQQRLLDCYAHKCALGMWMKWLRPARWITIISSTVLTAISGASLLSGPTGNAHTVLIASTCALIASVLTLLHTALKCEEHQALCNRLIGSFAELEAGFQALQLFSNDAQETDAKALEVRYEKLVAESAAIAPAKYLNRAKREAASAA